MRPNGRRIGSIRRCWPSGGRAVTFAPWYMPPRHLPSSLYPPALWFSEPFDLAICVKFYPKFQALLNTRYCYRCRDVAWNVFLLLTTLQKRLNRLIYCLRWRPSWSIWAAVAMLAGATIAVATGFILSISFSHNISLILNRSHNQ